MIEWLNNLRFRPKLLTAFSGTFFVAFAPVVVTVIAAGELQEVVEAGDREAREMLFLKDFGADLLRLELIHERALARGAPVDDSALLQAIAEKTEQAVAGAENAKEAGETAQLRRLLDAYVASDKELMALVRSGAPAEQHDAVVGRREAEAAALNQRVEAMVADAVADTREAQEEAWGDVRLGLWVALGCAAASLLLGVILSLLLAREISQPIARLRDVANSVSNGDLSMSIDIHQGDEIGDLAAAFERMLVAVRYYASLLSPEGDPAKGEKVTL